MSEIPGMRFGMALLLLFLLTGPLLARPELQLSPALEPERPALTAALEAAHGRLARFARTHGWEGLIEEPFYDRVEFYDQKPAYDQRLRELTGMQGEIPPTYVAALEQRVLVAVSPALYRQLVPQGDEPDAFEKLLCHELAHRLHGRILGGDEEAMGPIWFFEGFAVYASDQFAETSLSKPELWQVVASQERGSYRSYRAVMNYLVSQTDLPRLVQWARSPGFVDQLRLLWVTVVAQREGDQFHFGPDGITVISHMGIGQVHLQAGAGWPEQLMFRFTYEGGTAMSRIENLAFETSQGSWQTSTPRPVFRPAIASASQPTLTMDGKVPVLTIPADFLANCPELKLGWIDAYRR